MSKEEQLQFLRQIATRLDSIGVPYMLTGSMAMLPYMSPRMTRDIDIVVELNLTDVDSLVELFSPDCYIERDAVRQAVQNHSMFNVIQRDLALKIDFVVRKKGEYRELEFSRRKQLDLLGTKFWVVSLEDLILSKLVWSKSSQSAVQRRDVRELLIAELPLDGDYLHKWARSLGVAQALEEVMNDV